MNNIWDVLRHLVGQAHFTSDEHKAAALRVIDDDQAATDGPGQVPAASSPPAPAGPEPSAAPDEGDSE